MRNDDDMNEDLRLLDPVDGERLAAAWSSADAKTALFQEITSMPADTLHHAPAPAPAPAPARPARRRRRWALAAGLAVASVALVTTGNAFRGADPAYAVRQLDNGVIEIDWLDPDIDVDALAADLRQFGVDVELTPLPASPSAVGPIWGIAVGEGAGIPEGVTWGEDGTREVFVWSIDPTVYKGPMTIDVGVAAAPGEAYMVAEEVFEPGEVLGGLHCALGEPLRAADVAERLPELGITPVWDVISGIVPDADGGTHQETTVAETPEGQVMWGYARNDSTVRFSVLPDGVDPDFLQPRLSDVPCTAEQAAAWG